MTEKEEEKEYFEMYYHPNEYTYSFKKAFESLAEAESVIKKEYPGFDLVKEADAKPPFVSITNENYSKGTVISIFYSKIYD